MNKLLKGLMELRSLHEEDETPKEEVSEKDASEEEEVVEEEEEGSWIIPIARIATTAIAGTHTFNFPTRKSKKAKPDAPNGYLVPVIEEYRRMSGFSLQEEHLGPTVEDVDVASLLAVVAEMVGLDLTDLLKLEEEEFTKVADAVAPNITDVDQVQKAAVAAKDHSASAVMNLVQNPDSRNLLYDRLERIEERQKHWIQKAIKHPGALHRQLRTPKAKKLSTPKLRKAARSGGKLGRRARLAITLKKFR